MRIDGVECFRVAMPLIKPWTTAYGSDSVIESVLVRVWSGDVSAWGEACPLSAPTYCNEHAAGVFCTLKEHFAKCVVGKDIASGAELQAALAVFKGNPFAKGALDTAWWALESKLTGQPLHALMTAASGLPLADATGTGCDPTEAVAVGADFGVQDSVDELLDLIAEAFANGAPRVKLKCCKGWDTNMLSAVRKRFPPPAVFHIDCNGGYDLKNPEDVAFLKSLDQYKLAMVEQPLPPATAGASGDLLDHAKLAQMIETPVCLDESLCSLAAAEVAVSLGSAKYFNIKPSRCGGVTVALDIMRLAHEHGIPCWVGGMLESGVGVQFCQALAGLAPCSYPADLFPSTKYYHEDLADETVSVFSHAASGGRQVPCVAVPNRPHTVAPDATRLDRCTVDRFEFVA